MPGDEAIIDRYNRTFVEELVVALRGHFLVLDGPDGSGKTTQLALFESLLRQSTNDLLVLRDPGGTAVGEAIRNLVLHNGFIEMRALTEMLLFMASRAQLVREAIEPALRDGYIVICDRFLSSTYAYQSWLPKCGVKPEHEYVRFKTIQNIAKHVIGDTISSQYKTFIFQLDLHSSMKRMHGGEIEHHGARVMHGGSADQMLLFGDRIELMAAVYLRKVVAMYRKLCDKWPDRYIAVDASGPSEIVFDNLLERIKHSFHVTNTPFASNEGILPRCSPAGKRGPR